MNYQQIQVKIAAALPHDKCLHAIGGQVLALASIRLGVLMSLGIVLAVGVLKEVYDLLHPADHTAEVLDTVATFLGGVPVWVLWVLWHRSMNGFLL